MSNPISSYDIDKKMNGIPVTRTSRLYEKNQNRHNQDRNERRQTEERKTNSLRRKTCREEWQGRQDIGIVGDRNRSRGQAIRKTVE